MQFDGEVAIITGAARGIGRAVASRLASGAARVIVADIDADAGDSAARELCEAGGDARSIPCDVGDVDAVHELVHTTLDELGRLDILVNNAGVSSRASFFDTDVDDWDRIHRVNARGTFFLMQTAARAMRDSGGGRIVNISSIGGKGYRQANAAYGASKAAMIGMTRVAALQLAPFDIRVNVVCPGPTVTEGALATSQRLAAAEGGSPEETWRRLAREIPLGRPNDVVDVAEVVCFLASRASRQVTGQSWNVDGGMVFD